MKIHDTEKGAMLRVYHFFLRSNEIQDLGSPASVKAEHRILRIAGSRFFISTIWDNRGVRHNVDGINSISIIARNKHEVYLVAKYLMDSGLFTKERMIAQKEDWKYAIFAPDARTFHSLLTKYAIFIGGGVAGGGFEWITYRFFDRTFLSIDNEVVASGNISECLEELRVRVSDDEFAEISTWVHFLQEGYPDFGHIDFKKIGAGRYRLLVSE